MTDFKDFKFNEPSSFDWLTSFTKSGIESVPELVGITPSTETLNWRQDHPISGLVSEFAGMAVPYLGWYRALSTVPKLKKLSAAIDKVGDAVNSPIGTGFKHEVLKLAPFEAGRVGVSQVIGDKDFSDMAGGAVLNLALGGGIGGLVKGVQAAGKRYPSIATIFPGIDIAAPAPLQARYMKSVLEGGSVPPELAPKANLSLRTAMDFSRREELRGTERYIGPMVSPIKSLTRDLNRWFKPTEGDKSLQVRKFDRAVEKDFPTMEAWKGESKLAGLDDFFPAFGQYFRSVSFNLARPGKMPQAVDNRITKGMEPLGDNWFIAREADDGLFVMAKKYNGEPGKADPTDKWLMFKTDTPGQFAKVNQKWADAMVGLQKWLPEGSFNQDYGAIGNVLKGWMQEFPFRNYRVLGTPSAMSKAVDKFLPKNVGKDNELFHRVKEAFREYLVPRIRQFAHSPRANWMSTGSRLVYGQAESIVNEIMNGVVKLDAGKQLFYNKLANIPGPLGLTPIRPTAKAIDEKTEWPDLFKNWINNAFPKKMELAENAYQKGEISEAGISLLRAMDKVDQFNTQNIGLVEKAVGKKPTKWLEGHLGWSHTWEGDTRIFLHNEDGAVTAVVGGVNKKSAQQTAKELREENPTWKMGETYSKSQVLDDFSKGKAVPDQLRPLIMSPSFILERTGVRGHKWDRKVPSIEEFLQDFENMQRGRQRYQANLTADDMLAADLGKLQTEDAAVYRQLVDRMNADAGIPTQWERIQNRFTDQLLAPMIGERSASKIVGYTNTTLFNFHLGALKLSYPAMNAVSFLQTVNPEVAFILSAPEARLAPTYSFFALGGTKGPSAGVGVLTPARLTFQSLREMAKPSQEVTEAVTWGLNNRTLDPRFVEGYIGESSTKLADWRKVLSGDEPFLGWIRALSEWLPAHSEKFSRTHAFTTGYILARDFLKGKNGELLSIAQRREFARDFANNTMYLYSAADKPKVLTTPAGQAMGLFKNWLFHYIGQMGQYADEAFMHNNWSPLLWQTAGTAAVGGLAASPIHWVADSFSQIFSGKSAMQNVYDELGEWGDGVMYGLPALLSGGAVSLYSQAAVPGADPMRDASMMFSSVVWDRMMASKRAVGGAIDHWRATGQHPGSNAQVRLELARAFAPVTIYRSMATMDDGTIVSPGTGYPMVKDISYIGRQLYKLGVNSTELDRAMAVSSELYSDRAKMTAAIARLGEAWAHAQQAGDQQQMAMIMRQAMTQGIDVGKIIRSGMQRISNMQQDILERNFKPQDVAPYLNVLGR